MGRTEQQLSKEGDDESGSEPDSDQGIESSCSSPFGNLPMELIIVIVEFASRDFWTACSLSAVSKAIRGCIPAIFFRTTIICPPYPLANRAPRPLIKYGGDCSDTKNIFIVMGTDNDNLILSQTKPKHLCIQRLAMGDFISGSSNPLPSSLTHLIVGVDHYDISLFFYYLRPETITHMFVKVIQNSGPKLSSHTAVFPSRRLEALVYPAESCHVLERDFEKFLDGLDGLPQLQVIGLCPHHFIRDRDPSVSYTEMKRSLAGLTHRNASRVVAMPLEAVTLSQWYDWLQPDEERVWDKASRLLKEKQESVVKD
ncbi:hypothetical protein BU17DRAFT_85774 [Hysterangium stoloniferum]|nr:hypothetical protein BU17DRAFT_85774 [Hysterangium stoloniferum]